MRRDWQFQWKDYGPDHFNPGTISLKARTGMRAFGYICFMSLKSYKPVHWLYNLLHLGKLQHNKAAYRKYNLNKPLTGSISSKDFPDKTSRAWLDTGDSAELAPQKDGFQNFSSDIQKGIFEWSEKGYLIIEQCFKASQCDEINSEIERLLSTHQIKFKYGNKLMFANKKSDTIRQMAEDPALVRLLEFLLDREIVAFQTINFLKGSGQRAHSDSIHMTTYPLGYLIAAWIALEDISHENGPLFYYPGSHKLPFLLNGGFNTGSTLLKLGNKDYHDYEDAIADLLTQHDFPQKEFLAKKGDVLIWHANLIHGGAPILNPALSRKSMVVHYYAKDVIKYHEITERPSLL